MHATGNGGPSEASAPVFHANMRECAPAWVRTHLNTALLDSPNNEVPALCHDRNAPVCITHTEREFVQASQGSCGSGHCCCALSHHLDGFPELCASRRGCLNSTGMLVFSSHCWIPRSCLQGPLRTHAWCLIPSHKRPRAAALSTARAASCAMVHEQAQTWTLRHPFRCVFMARVVCSPSRYKLYVVDSAPPGEQQRLLAAPQHSWALQTWDRGTHEWI